MRYACPLMLLAMATQASEAQEPGSDFVRLAQDDEIALARSAAPPYVSDSATVWVFRNGQFEIVQEGSNGNHCFVTRSQPQSLEPICYDTEAAATILPIEMRTLQLRLEGSSADEIEALIAQEIGSGALRVPRRAAMSYMMSSGQILYAPDGRRVGNWRPHLMMYVPYITHQDIGLTAGPTPELQVFNPGQPTAHIIIVVPEFVDPQR